MILVFLSFLLGDSIIIQQFGVGLAAAIIIDAFIVRTILVPALMHLFGRANWWLPGWLDRRLPAPRGRCAGRRAGEVGSPARTQLGNIPPPAQPTK